MTIVKKLQNAKNLNEFYSIYRSCSLYELLCLAQILNVNLTEFNHRRLNWELPLEEILNGFVKCYFFDTLKSLA